MPTAFVMNFLVFGEFDCKTKLTSTGKEEYSAPKTIRETSHIIREEFRGHDPCNRGIGSRDENKLSKHQIQKAREKAKREAKVRINLLIFIHKYLRQFCNSVWWKARHLDVLMVDNDQLELVITGCFLIHLEAYYVLGPLSHGHDPAGFKRQF